MEFKISKIQKLNRRDFLRGAVFLTATTLLTACFPNNGQREAGRNYLLPTVDLSENFFQDKETPPLFSPYLAVFIPLSSVAEYNVAFNNQLTVTNDKYFIGAQMFGGQNEFYFEWLARQDVSNVTEVVANMLANGDPDFTTPDKWLQLFSSKSNIEHQRLMQVIGEQGIGKDITMSGYFPDVSQRSSSNILKQVLVVRFENKQYVIKIHNSDEAINEMGALVKLQQKNPKIRVSDVTSFKLNKQPTNRLAFTISTLSEQPDGFPAPTLLDVFNDGQQLNLVQQQQLKEIYQTSLINITDPSDIIKFHADTMQPYNIVIDTDGNLVVVDAFSFPRRVQILNSDQTIRTSNQAINSSLLKMKDVMRRAGIPDEEVFVIEQNILNAMNADLSLEVRPLAQATINVVDEATGQVHLVNATNNMDKSILLPQRIPLGVWEKIFVGINIATAVLAGLSIGVEIAQRLVSTDDLYEAQMMAAIDTGDSTGNHARRNLPYEVYEQIADGTQSHEQYFRGHITFKKNIGDLEAQIIKHHWLRSMREGLNLPQGSSALQVRLQHSSGLTENTELYEDFDSDLIGNNRLIISTKSPLISKNNNKLSLTLVAKSYEKLSIDPQFREYLQSTFDNLDQILSDEINFYWGKGEKWHVLDKLKDLNEAGYISFWTITDEGYIIYGMQTGDNIEMRYLSYEDQSAPMYKGSTDNKLHYLNRALKISELAEL
ncbi:MAG: twin-arginine translocation signal domain-containing protein [Patescibacteria group bacterium]|jgi:hypothetical protein